jgi:hypothetical protein
MLIMAGHHLVDAAQRDACAEAFDDLVRRALADPPEVDVKMLDMRMSTFHIQRESDPSD